MVNTPKRSMVTHIMKSFMVIIVCVVILLMFLQYRQDRGCWSSNSAAQPSTNSSTCHASSSSLSSSSSSTTKKQLLLVTVGRSGSSYTSALISNDTNVFFSFEPLHVINHLIYTADNVKKATFEERAHNIVKAFLSCDFTNVLPSDLTNSFITHPGPAQKRFYTCIRVNDTGVEYIKCLQHVVKHCRSKTVSFSKVIRLPMRWTERFLLEFPYLKILYLVRDPRAVLRSQSQAFRTFRWPEDIPQRSQSHCRKLMNDTGEVLRLQRLFPGRIRLIRYENCAKDPVQYTRDLYEFAGLKFTNNTLDYIASLQRPKSRDLKDAFSVKRSNSKQILNEWRYSPGAYTSAKAVDEACKDVYPRIGYLPVMSPSHLVSSRSLITEPQGFN